MNVELILQIEQRAAALDGLDYFEVLRVAHGASTAEIKAAYYRESRAYHPDRFAAVPSPELRQLVSRIYRRVNEAYTVLRDDAKRDQYTADVTGPERAGKLRFTEAEESAVKEQQKRKLEDQFGHTANGRKLYAAALREVEAQRWAAAERTLRTALAYEPANARFKELLAVVARSKPKSDPYRIK